MSKFRICIDDEITYQRRQIVEVDADSEEAACDKVHDMAIDGAGDFHDHWVEEQMDATGYSMRVATPEDDEYVRFNS